VTHSGACGLRGVDGPIPAGRANALPPSDDALPAALDSLIAEAQMSCAEPASETLHAIRDRLAQPPRVAVVGRVSSGKSTLVNALLGVRAAPTGAGETTTLAHWYRWGRLSTATLVTATGPVPLPEFEDGVPDDLPVPVDRIERIEVTRPVPLLRQLTVIDTPGLASAGAGSNRRTADATIAAAGMADAVVLVVNGALMADEAAAVAEIRSGSARDPLAAGTALAVLTKADQVGARTDALERARLVSNGLAVRHGDMFAAVDPVVGLLGETAATGRLDEHDALALAQLALEWDDDMVDLALSDHRLFSELQAEVPAERRVRLLDLLGLWGIGELVGLVRAGVVEPAAGPLCDQVLRLSGLAGVHDTLSRVIVARADALRAGTAVRALVEAATMPGAPPWLADRVRAWQLASVGAVAER
jgi:hypothetical protein